MLVSVITVVLNAKATIEDTVRSVASQTCKNVEHIVVDGGSTDGTLELIEKHRSHFAKVIFGPDKGIFDGMNKGILAASGDIVGCLNADDMFFDASALQRIVSTFENNDIDCLYGDLVYVARQDSTRITRVWRSRPYREGLFEKSWTPAHPTFYCKKSLYSTFGLYRTDLAIASDAELMYRFLQKNRVRSKYLNADLVRMRDLGVSTRGLKSTAAITREMQRAIVENGGCFNLAKYLFFKFLKIGEIFSAYGKRRLLYDKTCL